MSTSKKSKKPTKTPKHRRAGNGRSRFTPAMFGEATERHRRGETLQQIANGIQALFGETFTPSAVKRALVRAALTTAASPSTPLTMGDVQRLALDAVGPGVVLRLPWSSVDDADRELAADASRFVTSWYVSETRSAAEQALAGVPLALTLDLLADALERGAVVSGPAGAALQRLARAVQP